MLLTADWVLPVDGRPIRSGVVLLRGQKIARVGTAEDFGDIEGETRVDYPGHIIVPGLVNAHTHLSLSALEGILPPDPFERWLPKLVSVMRHLGEDDMAASAALGALRCLRSGVTSVGDIAYGPEASATASDLGVGGVFFWEVLGIPAERLERELAAAEFPMSQEALAGYSGRVRFGISPHSAYSSGPGLLRAVDRFARDRGFPVAIHVSESLAELEAVRSGDGPLSAALRRLAPDFEPKGLSPVEYLAGLGVLAGAVAVHCVQLTKSEVDVVAGQARGVVVCPGSNAYLRNGSPPVKYMRLAGVTIGVGTDSLASNSAMDLFAEARAVGRIAPMMKPRDLVGMMTLDGASVLGMDDRIGSLTPGKQADVAIVRCGPAATPEEALLAACPADVEAVISGGHWRVRAGRPVFPTEKIESAAADVTGKASRIVRKSG